MWTEGQRKTPAGWAWMSVAVAAVVLLWLARMGAPPLDQDASYFLGAAVNLVRGDGLTNRLDALLVAQDPAGQARYLAYPSGFPSILGLLGVRGLDTGYLVMAALGIVALGSVAMLLQSAVRDTMGRVTMAVAVLGYSSLFANAAFRPEVLSVPLVVLWVTGAQRIQEDRRRDLLLGLLAGVTAHVQVPIALYEVLVWPALAGRTSSSVALIPRAVRFGGSVGVGLAAGLLLHPYGAADYLHSFLAFSTNVLSWGYRAEWAHYWVLGVRFPGLIIPAALATACGAAMLPRAVREWKSPVALLISVTGIVALLVRDTIWMPNRWYEAAALLPVGYWALLVVSQGDQLGQARRTLLRGLVLGAVSVGVAGLAWRMVQGVAQQHAGTSVRQAQTALRREVARSGTRGVIAVEAPIGFLLDDPSRGCLAAREGTNARMLTCGTRPALLITFEGRRRASAGPIATHLDADVAGRSERPDAWRLVCVFSGDAPVTPLPKLDALGRAWSFAVYARERPRRSPVVNQTTFQGAEDGQRTAVRCGAP